MRNWRLLCDPNSVDDCGHVITSAIRFAVHVCFEDELAVGTINVPHGSRSPDGWIAFLCPLEIQRCCDRPINTELLDLTLSVGAIRNLQLTIFVTLNTIQG